MAELNDWSKMNLPRIGEDGRPIDQPVTVPSRQADDLVRHPDDCSCGHCIGRPRYGPRGLVGHPRQVDEALDRLRDILDAATPGEWRVETDSVDYSYDYPDPRDCTFLWRIAANGKGILNLTEEDTSEADATLAALSPELAALCLDMGEALRKGLSGGPKAEWVTVDADEVDALLARLDGLVAGKGET